MAVARRTVEAVLAAHAPFPALAIDRHWTLVTANAAVPPLLAGVAAHLLAPPVNVLRLSLHPDGLALPHRQPGRVAWPPVGAAAGADRRHRRRRPARAPGGAGGIPFHRQPGRPGNFAGIAVPLRLRVPGLPDPLSFISTTTVFGTPVDVTLSELALECFYPADEATRAALIGQGRVEVQPSGSADALAIRNRQGACTNAIGSRLLWPPPNG